MALLIPLFPADCFPPACPQANALPELPAFFFFGGLLAVHICWPLFVLTSCWLPMQLAVAAHTRKGVCAIIAAGCGGVMSFCRIFACASYLKTCKRPLPHPRPHPGHPGHEHSTAHRRRLAGGPHLGLCGKTWGESRWQAH